ncbi:hypothetical protein [Haliea sp. E17]|uniref:hypothetical protein n=1 Tax=Haliea sp. E17 TaxID=3401576 RepID=UPI003AAB2D1A
MPRPKKPKHLALLDGSARKNPQRYRNEDRFHSDGLGEPPEHLTEAQEATWREIEAKALPGLLMASDRFMVEIAACLLAEYRSAPGDFRSGKLTTLNSLLYKLGLTPGSAQRFGIETAKKDLADNPFAQF